MIFKERPGTEKSVFVDTLGGRDDLSEGGEVAELCLETCDERIPRRVVKDSIEDT